MYACLVYVYAYVCMYMHTYVCAPNVNCKMFVINSMQVFDREGYDKPSIISQTFILYICKDTKLQLIS